MLFIVSLFSVDKSAVIVGKAWRGFHMATHKKHMKTKNYNIIKFEIIISFLTVSNLLLTIH